MKKYILIAFVLIFSLLGQKTHATHFAGADFFYECIGQDSFRITFNLFRDCSGAGTGTQEFFTLSSPCGTQNVTFQRDSLVEVSQLCPTALGNSTCSNGTLPGMQQAYYSGIVVLPPCATGNWTISWTSCCRNSSNNLVGQGSFWIGTTLNNNAAPCNNSPRFNAQPIPYVCSNQQVVYNFGVTEIDGDSLVFYLAPPLNNNATTPVAYQGTYTAANPFNVPVTLNPQTGEVTFTPTTNGFWVIKVCVDEYRNGILIGNICRDIQFVVQSCQNYQPYMMSPGITNFSGTGLQIDSNSVEVCIGNNFSFDIFFGDSLHPNQLPGQGDSITLSSNIQQVLPGANVIITNGNPASANVSWTAQPGASPFSIFIINAIDNACNIPGIASYAFDISIIPSTWAGPDQRLCQGEDTAFVDVVGGTEFVWQVLSGDAFNFGVNFKDTTGTNGQSVWMFPNQTTTYRVESNLSGTCINEDTITIFVSRNYLLNTFGDTLVCPNDSFNIFQLLAIPDTSASPTPPYFFNYQWSSGSFLNNDTIGNPLATITDNRTFNVTVSSDSGCVKQGSITIEFAPIFPNNISVQFTDTVLCLGDSTTAFVDFGAVIGNVCALATAPCGSNVSTGVIGTGTQSNTTTSYPAPYGNWYWGAKHQILYTAAELQALGMVTGGKITSIAFNVTNTNGAPVHQGFTIRMGCTSATQLTTTMINTGMSTVFGPSNHTITTGWNVHQLTTPYDWDGVSNLIVETCFNNTSFTSNASTSYTVTPFNSVTAYYQDASGVCSNTTGFLTSTLRPNIQFGFCVGYDPNAFTFNWSPTTSLSNPTIFDPFAFPTGQTTYTVIVSDTFGVCFDTAVGTINIVTAYDATHNLPSPVCVNGGLDTATFNTPGGVWSGPGIVDSLGGIFDPAIAGPGSKSIVHTLASPAGNCISRDTIVVNVVPKPDATITSPLEYCKQGDPVQLTAATPGGVWSGNSGIVNPTAGIFNPQALPVAGSYVLYYTLTTPCFNADTVTIKAYLPYNFNFIDTPKTLCVNDTLIFNNYIALTGPNYGSGPIKYVWGGPGITNPDSGHFNPNNIGPGNFFVNLTASDTNDQCATTKQMRVQVFSIDTPKVTGPLEFCNNTTSQLISIDRGFGNSATWGASPIPPASNALNISSSGTFNPQNTGPGTWVLTYTFTNNNGCVGGLTDTIIVNETPGQPLITSPNFCSGVDMLLSASGVEPDSVIWFPSIVASPGTELGFGSPFNYGTALYTGNEQRIFAQAVYGACKGPIVGYTIPVRPDAPAEFWLVFPDTSGTNPDGFDSVFVTPNGVFDKNNFPYTEKIIGLSPFSIKSIAQNLFASLGDTVQWDFWVNGTIRDQPYGWPARLPTLENIQNGNFHFPVGEYTYQKEGIYVIKMVHRNEFGCADTSFVEVDVRFQGDPPNIFTPNGDGFNDVFYIPGSQGLRDFKCEIYNRWGRKVFEFTNPDPINGGGWDGSGASDGVYFYIATGKRAGDVDYVKQGTVTLLKEKQ